MSNVGLTPISFPPNRARLASRCWSGSPGRAFTRRAPAKGFQLTSCSLYSSPKLLGTIPFCPSETPAFVSPFGGCHLFPSLIPSRKASRVKGRQAVRQVATDQLLNGSRHRRSDMSILHFGLIARVALGRAPSTLAHSPRMSVRPSADSSGTRLRVSSTHSDFPREWDSSFSAPSWSISPRTRMWAESFSLRWAAPRLCHWNCPGKHENAAGL